MQKNLLLKILLQNVEGKRKFRPYDRFWFRNAPEKPGPSMEVLDDGSFKNPLLRRVLIKDYFESYQLYVRCK